MTAPALTHQLRPTDDGWDDLQTTALLGTDRRPLPTLSGTTALRIAAEAVSREDQATALLELAALTAVRRRAGARALPAPPVLPEAAASDTRPELPDGAARRLTVLLGHRASTASVANLAELLPQWLHTAQRRGYRPPAALVPALLDTARARSELRADVVALVGPLGRWLAERNPEWKFVTRTPAGATTEQHDEPDTDDRLWHEGLFAERIAHLTRLRRSNPAAGLELLRSTWSTERAEDRVLFLDALQEGLSAADEPFLEAALTDRSKNVRAAAAELLSALPGSAFSARMAERARVCVQQDGDRLAVNPPTGCDAAMQRDGIAPKSPTGLGDRAWWFGEIVATAPLTIWKEDTGLTPDQLLRLPVGDGEADWADDLHEAWARAAVRQNNTAWARALLGPPPRPGRPGRPVGSPAKLLPVLPPAERAAWTAAHVQAHGLGEAFQLLGACATPWTPPLSTAVVAALERAARSGAYPWSHSGVLGLAERALAPVAAPAVEALAADAAPHTAWEETFNRLTATLRFREAMLAELAG